MISKQFRLALTLVMVGLVCTAATAQQGAVTLPRNLAELTTQAQTIVEGQILSASVEPHPQLTNIQTVVVTMRVSDTLKGKTSGQTLTFRQFIWDFRDKLNGAGWRKGQHVLLMLNAPTEYGLTSTAGLGQGHFHISRDAAGNEVAVNEAGNVALMRGVSSSLATTQTKLPADLSMLVQRAPAGPVRLDELKALITTMVKAN